MANEQNLHALSTEEAREIGRLGGIASGIARREAKTIRETVAAYIEGKTPEGMSRREALIAKTISNAFKKGEMKDLKTLCEILGELKQEAGGTNNTILNINTSEAGARNIQALATDDE